MKKKTKATLKKIIGQIVDIVIFDKDHTSDELNSILAGTNIIDAVIGGRAWEEVRNCITAKALDRANRTPCAYNIEHPSEQDWFEFPYQGEIITVVFGYMKAPDWEMDGNVICTQCDISVKNYQVRGNSYKHPNDQYDYYLGKKMALRNALKNHVLVRQHGIDSKYSLDQEGWQTALNDAIRDRAFRQMVWKEFFKAHGRNERGELL